MAVISIGGASMADGSVTAHPMRRLLSNRRGLLAGAAALVGAGLARLARPAIVQAGTDGDVVLGATNPPTGSVGTETRVMASTPFGPALSGNNLLATGTGMVGGTGGFSGAVPGAGVVGISSTGHATAGNEPFRGVYGTAGDVGVEGQSNNGGGDGIGVKGLSNGGAGVYGQSASNAGVYGKSTSNAGVFGDSPLVCVAGVTTNGLGVQGTSTTNAGVYGQSTSNAAVFGTSPYAGVYGTSANIGAWGVTTTGTGVFGQATNPNGWAGQFAGRVFVSGSFTVVNGAKSAAVKRRDGSLARMYCVEAPESWFEDFGSAQLQAGQATVALSADFDEVVDGADYRVFLTEIGDCGGLFVSRLAPHRFEVRSRGGATASGTFHYRVVAKRADPVGTRMERVDLPTPPEVRQAPRALTPDELPKPPARADERPAPGGRER